MKELQFDPGDGLCVEIIHGLQYVLVGFTGQPQDRMDNDRQPSFVQPQCGVLKTGKRISAPDIPGSPFMDGLEAQLHLDRFAAVQP